MARRSLQTLVRHLHRAVGAPAGGEVSDARLLDRWLSRRDEAAFELLVWRHGPLVLSACRRLLRDRHAAEDAFQATWLLFVRKAAGIRRGEAVPAWLHRVACRVALRARAAAAQRASREEQVGEVPEPPRADEAGLRDLRAVLDEEVDRLPEHYRQAFILCVLEGKTQEETARQLGRPRGTLSAWLTRARGRLRRCLLRRGVAPSAALAGVTVAESAAAVPGSLLAATVRAASGGAVPGVVSGEVAALVEGVLEASSMAKVKVAVYSLILLAGAGAAVLFGQGPAENRQPTPPMSRADVAAARPPMNAGAAEDGIAWGKRASGLQAGIGFRPGDRRTYRSDDSVTLVVYLRNVGGKVVRLSHTESLFAEWMPAVQDADGFPVAVAPGPIHSGDVPIVHRTLEPGEQIILGYPWFRVRPPSWRGPVVGPTLRAGPGKYRASFAGLPLRLEGGGKDTSGPPTGWVEWEIEPPGELRADRVEIAPKPAADVGKMYFTNQADLQIPFRLGKAEGDIRALNLFVSEDRGATYQLVEQASPRSKAFRFRAPRDGVYWFVVQTEGPAGHLEPADPRKTAPPIKVCVDTKVPEAKFGGYRQRGREAELWWVVCDENLDLETLRVEYRPAERGGAWHPVKVPPEAEGKVRWLPEPDGALEVRLRVKDRAGNEAEVMAEVPAAGPD